MQHAMELKGDKHRGVRIPRHILANQDSLNFFMVGDILFYASVEYGTCIRGVSNVYICVCV